MSFGTLKSKLWTVLNAGHYDVQLTPVERERIKCWIDLNCPLWPDYEHLPERPAELQASKTRRERRPPVEHWRGVGPPAFRVLARGIST